MTSTQPLAAGVVKATTAATIHLDAVRGVAALAVVAFHIRYKFFLDYSEVASTGLFTRLFYVATSFGHDAVMVFFVLSGYLIAGTVLKDVRTGRWSWVRYLLNRLTRLYVVLLPGLLLTVAWDLLGLYLFPTHPAYTGSVQAWKHDFFNVRETLTPTIAFANAAFMHAISGIAPLGSNSPLWSLTYEFAYYLMFPAMLLALWTTTGAGARVVCALLSVLLAYYFGYRILLYFPLWLMGLAIRLVSALPVDPLNLPRQNVVRLRNLSAVVLVVVVTAFRHTSLFSRLAGPSSLEVGDYLVGVSFAVALYVLLLDGRVATGGVYDAFARGSSHISYTLYVVHMPLLIFLRAFLNNGPQWSPGPGSVASAVMLFVAALAYASAVWYCFEAHTSTVRDAMSRRLTALGSRVSRVSG